MVNWQLSLRQLKSPHTVMNGNSHPNQPSTDSHWCLWKLLIVGEGKLWYYHNFSLALHTGPHTSDLWLREIPDWIQDSPVWLVVSQLMENLLLLLPVSFVNPGVCVCADRQIQQLWEGVWTLVLCPSVLLFPFCGNRRIQDCQAPELVDACVYSERKNTQHSWSPYTKRNCQIKNI